MARFGPACEELARSAEVQAVPLTLLRDERPWLMSSRENTFLWISRPLNSKITVEKRWWGEVEKVRDSDLERRVPGLYP